MDRFSNVDPSRRHPVSNNTTAQKQTKQETAAFEKHWRDLPQVDVANVHPGQAVDVSQHERIGTRTSRLMKGNSRSPLEGAAPLREGTFGEDRPLGRAADWDVEHNGPRKRQRILDNPREVAVQNLLSEIGNSGARGLMQAATSLPPAFDEAQMGRGRINNPDAPKKDLGDFKRPADQTQKSTLVTVGGDKRGLYSNDASLIGVLDSALRKGNVMETTIKLNVNPLLNFARWLVANGKPGFATRLDEASLKHDFKQYEASGGPSLEAPLRHLKTAEAGGVPILGRSVRNPYFPNEPLIKLHKATPSATLAIVGRDKRALYSKDASLIEVLESALRKGNVTETTVKLNVNPLLNFARWLVANGKQGFASRMGETSLTRDFKQYEGSGGPSLEAPMRYLKTAEAGGVPIGGRSVRNPYFQDRELIHLYSATPLVKSTDAGKAMRYKHALARFSDYLQKNGKMSIAARLNHKTLDDDVKLYPGDCSTIHAALEHLRNSGARQSGSHNAPGSHPEEEMATPVLEATKPAPSARANSVNFGGVQSFVDLRAPNPSDLGDDAHFAPGPPPGTRARSGTFGGLQSFVDLNAPTPSDLRDDAHSAPVRPRKQTLGDTERQTMMQGTEAAAVFGPGGPGDGPLMHRGRLSPMGEAAPATRAKIRQPASPVTTRPGDTYRGLPVVDLTTSTTTSSDTQLGASGPRASSNVAKGLVLGPDQWLADEHILRDYNLLHEQLQALDPMLAARTLLVDPSVSHLLRHRELQYARDILQSIYNRNAGPADFVFVPVNNGTLTREGSHWSLLLVDRRNPEMPVAYHYDSLQRAGHNNAPAKRLARVLNATSEPAPMAQQLNNHDCGVFVLDGTWELVRQLLDGQRPDHGPLPLDDLVADRPALQDRLRRRLPHE